MSANIRNLKAKKAEAVKAATALTDKVAAENRDFNAEEQQQFDAYKASITSLNAQIERAEFLADEAAGMGGVEVPAQAVITVTDRAAEDPKRGFKSFGEFARAVANANPAVGRGVDSRLTLQAAAPSTFGNEASGADGGFGIPPAFSTDLWRASLMGPDALLPLTENTEIGGNSMAFPKDETTPWGGSGIQAYWQSEAAAATASKPALSMDAMTLHKLMALVPVSNELIDDGFAVGSYLAQVAPERIQWKVDEAILFGDGIGKPLGALNSNALITVAKESGQAANTVDPKNVSKMVSRLLVGQLKNAVWIGNPDVLVALEAMTVGNYPIFLPSQSASNGSYGMLKGRPMLLSEHASALSSAGDLNLLSLKGYRTITKAGGVQSATSMHLYFDADATAFKFSFRINGKPILSAPITPPKATSSTRSHFISLGAR